MQRKPQFVVALDAQIPVDLMADAITLRLGTVLT